MTKEELQEYQETLALYIDSAQYEYRQQHPSCLYCECLKKGTWSGEYKCRVTLEYFNFGWESDQKKAKRKARFCKYYFPTTDLSKS